MFRGCTTCILSYSIFHFALFEISTLDTDEECGEVILSFLPCATVAHKASNNTHSRKKKHCSYRNIPRATCTVLEQMNVGRTLVTAFFARLFSHSMDQNRHKNGFITKSPLVAIQEYHDRDLFFHSRFFIDYHWGDNLRIDWPVSQQLLSRHHIYSSLRLDSSTSITWSF